VTIGTPSRHGPTLPYSLVAGVTPCGRGWLVASAKVAGTVFAPEEPAHRPTFVDVLDERPAYSVIAVNAPIGYLDQAVVGGRNCDKEARTLLGHHRGASIQSAPVRVSATRDLELRDDHLDAISLALLPRYREVAAEMAPFRQRTVYEAHSDLSFYQMNGEVPLEFRKHSEEGLKERRTLLETKVPGIERVLDAEIPGVRPFHLVDAAVFMWTARRIFNRAAIRIPADPEWDEQGLRMEIFR
jgi:predicted RNase H-like nuclease